MAEPFPPNPDYEADVRATLARQGLMGYLGALVELVEPGRCDLRLPFRPELSQQNGYFHAGAVTTLADNAGGMAAYSLLPAGAAILTVEFKINFMAPARGTDILARGRVEKAGRTLSVCSVEVLCREDGRQTVCALMQQTLIAMPAVR